jgi:myo-inositol 2-dehydrogenase / D-chiro-inositol 1-dehydrogenase
MERRTFIKSTGIITAGTIAAPHLVFGRRSASTVQLGIIGCGGRGTAVITSMMKNNNCQIIAMADLFEDKLKWGAPIYNQLNKDKGFGDIKSTNMYKGSKAYQQLLNNKEVDAVLISSPAYTHPEFLEAAVAAGKHVYCEKPAAIDVDGCRRIQRAGKSVNNKSVVIGFQIRRASAYAEMIKRIHAGDIGELINAQVYYLSSRNEVKGKPSMSKDEFMIRDHFHYRSVSGGILLDQGIHMLDVCNWGLRSLPIKAIGNGGLKLSEHQGDAWNHYQVIYEYPNGTHVTCQSTQFGNTFGDVCARFLGTKGMAEAHYSGGVFINGENEWDSGVVRDDAKVTPEQRASGAFLSSLEDADPNKGKSFIGSIESGNYLNECEQGATSTLTAILGRQAAEMKKEMTWEKMITANEKINPGLNLAQFDK